MLITRLFLLIVACAFLLFSCEQGNQIDKSTPSAAFTKERTIIIQWNELLYYHIKHQIIGPPVASRMYGYIGVSAYQSVLHGMPGNRSMAGQLNGLEELPEPDVKQIHDWPTVMIETLYHICDELLSRFISGTDKSLTRLRKKQLEERKSVVEETVFDISVVFGKTLADALLVWMADDNYDATRFDFFKTPPRTNHPEFWEPTDFNQVAHIHIK